MKLLSALILTLGVASSYAATPLLQYSWSESGKSSFLMIFDNGGILHQEKAHYQNKTIPESKLTYEEIILIKKLIEKIQNEKVFSSPVEVGESAQQGTLMVHSQGGMKVVEGVVIDSIDNSQGIMYHMDALEIAELKNLVFKYTDNDMSF